MYSFKSEALSYSFAPSALWLSLGLASHSVQVWWMGELWCLCNYIKNHEDLLYPLFLMLLEIPSTGTNKNDAALQEHYIHSWGLLITYFAEVIMIPKV